MRLDRALIADLRTASRSRVVRLFLVLEVLAGIVFVVRRGPETATTVLLIWVGMAILAFFAWWAGRNPRAHPRADAVPVPAAQTMFALVGVAGLLLVGAEVSLEAGVVLIAGGFAGWIWAVWRSGGTVAVRDRLLRDPLPFVPLLLLIGLPRLIVGGPGYLVAILIALPSGIGQQLLYLVGLFAPLEALRRQTDVAAVSAALIFAVIHVPVVLEANGGDVLASLANVILFQASVGLIACLAYVRHRAAVPIGIAHALAIA